MNIIEFGFDEDELNALDDVEEDEVPEVDEESEPITRPGDLYQLGEHRLLCGDSISIEDVATLTAGAKIALLLTDPPYNVAYEGQNGNTKIFKRKLAPNLDAIKYIRESKKNNVFKDTILV